MQDSRGFLWVGTSSGLNRYDGYSFKVYKYNPDDSLSILGNGINAIHEDQSKRLWILTNGEVINQYLPELDGFKHYPLFPRAKTQGEWQPGGTISEDRGGTIWVGLAGLHSYDRRTDSFVAYRPVQNPATHALNSGITAICEDTDGAFWIATGDGLLRLDRKTGIMERIHPRPLGTTSIGNVPVSTLIDEDSSLWVGTMGNGLFRLDKRSRSASKYHNKNKDPLSLGNDEVSALFKDAAGVLWIGTWNRGGLNVFNPRQPGKPRFHRFQRTPGSKTSLSENRIFAITEDRSGNVWIGTHLGLNKVSRARQFGTILDGVQVTDAFRSKSGHIWVATMGEGVKVLDTSNRIVRSWRAGAGFGGLASDFVYALHEGKSGEVWVGQYLLGLSRIDRSTGGVKRYGFPTSTNLHPTGVDRFMDTPNGELLVDTDRGTFVVNNRTGMKAAFSQGIVLHQDAEGSIWRFDEQGFGVMGAGSTSQTVHMYDSVQFPAKQRLHISNVLRDVEDNIWMLVRGWGLIRYNIRTRSYQKFTVEESFPHPALYSFVRDAAGHFWIGTANGLVRFDPNKRRSRRYTVADGLPTNHFYGRATLVTEDRGFFFGTTSGLLNFCPDEIAMDTIAPSILLTGFSTLHRPKPFASDVSLVQSIEITFRENVFTFNVAAIGLGNPSLNTYSYMMEGFDEDWIAAGSRRSYTYTNLDPGSYTFRVKAANSDGIWNEHGLTVGLDITPPFWLTWWFLSAVAATILGVIIYLYNWRVGRLLEVERTRDRIARDLHDDIASTLGSIALYSSSLRARLGSRSTAAGDLLDRISRLSVEAVDSMSDIVWSLAPQHDSVRQLLTHLQDVVSQVCTASGIEYSVKLPEIERDVQLDPTSRKNFYLILKEALNNSVRHSRPTHITFHVVVADGWLEATLQDNGLGFVVDAGTTSRGKFRDNPRGHGLRNMHHRAHAIGARLTINSAPDAGTIVKLSKRMT